MRSVVAICVVTFLASCGADGAPVRPTEPAAQTTTTSETGIKVSGYATVGVSTQF